MHVMHIHTASHKPPSHSRVGSGASILVKGFTHTTPTGVSVSVPRVDIIYSRGQVELPMVVSLVYYTTPVLLKTVLTIREVHHDTISRPELICACKCIYINLLRFFHTSNSLISWSKLDLAYEERDLFMSSIWVSTSSWERCGVNLVSTFLASVSRPCNISHLSMRRDTIDHLAGS